MTTPRIHIATDHAGLGLSQYLVGHLRSVGHLVVDHGPSSYDGHSRLSVEVS